MPVSTVAADTPVALPTPLPAWRRRLLALWPGAAAVLSGVLLTLAYAPFDQGWLCWVALVPLVGAVWWVVSFVPQTRSPWQNSPSRLRRWLAHLRRRPGARAAALGYGFGLVFFWGTFSWLTTVTVPGWVVLGPYFALYPALWAWFLGRTILALGLAAGTETGRARVVRSRWNLLLTAVGAAAWVGQEWVRGWLFSGWGWNALGIALHGQIAFLQLAEWTGVGGLSFLAAWTNLVGAATLRRFYVELVVRPRREGWRTPPSPSSGPPRLGSHGNYGLPTRHDGRGRPGLTLLPMRQAGGGGGGHGGMRPHFDFTLTLAGVFAAFTWGYARLEPLRRDQLGPGETRLRVAAVQAAIPQFRKWDRQFQQEIFDTYQDLTEIALAGGPQLLLWPEAATPQGFLNERENYEFVRGFAERGPFNFILGTILGEPDPDRPNVGRDYNAAALFNPATEFPAQLYRKLHLVPFGEFIPFRHSFPLFAWIAGHQVPSDFDAGDAPAVFQLEDPDVRAAPLICFEDTLGPLVRRFVLPQPGGEAGAQFLVNLTNDGWFGRSAAGRQQLNEAVFRTVENRRPMVRCANTGVTCFVDRFGRVTQTLRAADGDLFGPGVLAGEIVVPAPDAPRTFYTRHGEVFSGSCAAVATLVGLGYLAAPFVRRWRSARP